MRFTEMFQTIPFFLFAILLVAVLTPSIANVILAIAVVSWPPMARLVRGEFLAMRSREFVLACVSMGMNDARIILLHILPNTLSAIIVTGSLMIATAILIESGLSFLGLSDPNAMSWGYIIGEGRTALRTRMVGLHDSGHRDPGHGHGHQPGRRGTQRRPQPAAAHRVSGKGTVLAIERLTVDLPPWADRPHAVEDVTLELQHDEILCVVGESGSGKSLMARSILGLFPSRHVRPSAGRILYGGEDLLKAAPEHLRALRGSRIAMIFQEPMTALNPVLTIGRQIEEVIEIHQPAAREARRRRVLDMLSAVHLPEPVRMYNAYPHQISGGQRQRAMIAMALTLEPDILIADEPTTALDVTTQAQILALIREIQSTRHMAVLFITHDFGVVAEIADRIAVMQRGRLVEHGPAERVLDAPHEPYTRTLLAAVPDLTPASPRKGFAQARRRDARLGARKDVSLRWTSLWRLRRMSFMPPRAWPSKFAAARRSASSANRARASPPSRGAWLVSSRRTPARSASAIPTSDG